MEVNQAHRKPFLYSSHCLCICLCTVRTHSTYTHKYICTLIPRFIYLVICHENLFMPLALNIWPSFSWSICFVISLIKSSLLACSIAKLCLILWWPPWIDPCQAPLSMGFPRQGYWSGLPFPSLRDLLDLGIKPVSPSAPALAGGFFTTESPGKLLNSWVIV